MRFIRTAALTAVLAASTILAVGPVTAASAAVQTRAHTTATPARQNDDPSWIDYRGVHRRFLGDFSGDWTHCNWVTKSKGYQQAGCTEGKIVTETVTGAAGFSDGIISDHVGFNVSYATIVTATNSVEVKPGGQGWFDVGFRYGRFTIGMEDRYCSAHTGCRPWSKPHTVTVQHHLSGTFHYFGTGAVRG